VSRMSRSSSAVKYDAVVRERRRVDRFEVAHDGSPRQLLLGVRCAAGVHHPSLRMPALDNPLLPSQWWGKQTSPTAVSSSNRACIVVLNVFS
jgi:hypothetical protein